jgi:hypothetical protein
MSTIKYLLSAMTLAGALALASCGGGSNGVMPSQQAGQRVVEGEPNGGVPVTAEFIAQAQGASCADQRNRLFMIDKQMVFWDRVGNCADNSYARNLFGATPQALLCSATDSVGGPRITCADAQRRAMFDTILANLDKGDLGLGSGHQVEPLSVPPKPLAFDTLERTSHSGIEAAAQITIRDADSFQLLWSAHSSGVLPLVDFSRNMVIGVFMGTQSNGCYSTDIDSVTSSAGKITVQYTDSAPGPTVMCTLAMTTAAHLIVVARSEQPVEFVAKKKMIS